MSSTPGCWPELKIVSNALASSFSSPATVEKS
jgi:hypothetical protein